MTPQSEFKNKNIQYKFDTYPIEIRKNLLYIRKLIFDIASESDNIGELEETLKWDQPSYLTSKPKSGTTIRLGFIGLAEYAIYVHCQTTLIAEFKEVYPELNYEGNRAIILDSRKNLPIKTIKHFLYLALSYHHRKKSGIGI